jgi:replicative DNA helicase
MSESTAERAVIGSLLLDARVLRDVMTECTPADFRDARLARIYEGIMHMATVREPIDIITVSDHLAEWGVQGIGFTDLSAFTNEVTTSSFAGAHAAVVRSQALTRGLRAAATAMQDDAGNMRPEEAISAAMGRLKDLREHHTSDEITAMPLDEVLTQDVQYDWVIDGLIERRDRAIFTGGEGAGKTTLLRQMAITAASGIHPFREYPIDPVKVLVVDAENTEMQWGREVRRWAPSIGGLGEQDVYKRLHLACVRRLDLTKDSDLGAVHRLIDKHEPDLMLIGPLYRLIPRAINSDDDAAPLLAALDTIRDRGIAMLIEAHAGHAANPKGERDMRPRGSAALMGWPEFGYGLRLNRKNPLHVDKVRWRGDRDARGWPAKLGRSNVEGGQRWPWRPVDY